jgi:hypothetical protein
VSVPILSVMAFSVSPRFLYPIPSSRLI